MQARDIFALEGLAELGSRSGLDMRPTLLRILTDLYVHRFSHTPAEERHYTELALRLLEAVDVPTRVSVARRFARYLSPPLRVLQWLSRDIPQVTGELRAHPLLQPPVATAAATAIPAAMPVAEAKTAHGNELSADAARPLDRPTATELNEIFFTAGAEERRLILLNLDLAAPVAAVRSQVARDPSVGQRLEAAALVGKRDDFALELTRALHIPREQARRIAHDDLGEPVIVAAKTIGMPRDALYRVLMFLNPNVGHSVERVHALAALYDEMTAPAATGMLAIWQALHQAERTSIKYRPVAWDDESGRRAHPGAAVQRTPAAARPSQRRSAS